jgi:hypothetical protein
LAVGVVPAERAQERDSPGRRQRTREIERCPPGQSLDVGVTPVVARPVEMQERLAAHVENAAALLEHAGPGAQLGEEAGQVVEQLGRAVGHASPL